MSGAIVGTLLQKDIYDGGAFQVKGNIQKLGASGVYRVCLFDRRSKRCLRETWSAVDGSYVFLFVSYRYQGYFVVAYDHSGTPLNAAIADFVTPEAIP